MSDDGSPGRDVEVEATAPPPVAPVDTGMHGLDLRNIMSGLNWNSATQVATVVIYLGLTPFLLNRLGVDRYGIFALISSGRGLLSNLDLGLGPTSMRYFAVYAGAGDRRSSTGLLVTLSALLILVTGTVAGVAAIFAPQITSLVHTSPQLHHQGAVVLRWFMPLLVIQAIRAMFQRVMTAEHRWAYVNVTMFASFIAYAFVTILLVGGGYGLMGLVTASYVQEAVLLVTAIAGALPALKLSECRFLPRSVTRELLHFGLRVQISAVASSFNMEIDAIIVGLIFPVRFVGFYSIGSNFANQLGAIPQNGGPPISVAMSRTFGESGFAATLRQFRGLQRLWVRALAAYPLIGAASAYFAISTWLGPKDRIAGEVASILLVGQAMVITGVVMDLFGKSINRPDLESRYLGVGMIINIAFTVPLALTVGVLGVPIGTALGQITSGFYLLRIARREIDPDLPNFLREIPRFGVLVGVVVTSALVIPVSHVAPRGALGALACAGAAFVGLIAYALATFGVKDSFARVATLRLSR